MKTIKQFLEEAKIADHGHYMELGHYEARRHMKSRGDNFSGWVIRHNHDRHTMSDPISTREHAKKVMQQWHDEDEANGRNKRYDDLENHVNDLMKRHGR